MRTRAHVCVGHDTVPMAYGQYKPNTGESTAKFPSVFVMARTWKIFLAVSLVLNIVLVISVFHFNGSTNQLESKRSRPQRMSGPVGMDSLKSHPITFVGGVPRSGTTLLRAMLDAHPDIRCGEETRVIPRMISMRNKWTKSEKEHKRLLEAGLNDTVLDKATREFISSIIASNGPDASFLCNKDPLVLSYMPDVVRIYPKAKFVLMIRDGRAVAYSIVSHNVTISGVDSRSYVSAALFWNKVVMRMTTDCRYLGPSRCMQVHYEELVAEPQQWMEAILQFLNIPWHDNVLKHHKFINSEVSISKLEPSSNQIIHPVYTSSVNEWRKKIPSRDLRIIYEECDMLKELGYPAS